VTGDSHLFRRGPRALGTGARAVLIVLLTASGFAGAPVRSAADTPCDELQPAELALTPRADLLDLAVGDVVELQVEITNTTGGPAGIPLFRLLGAEPVFAVESQESSYPDVEFVRYRLRAVRPGQAAPWLAVNFETAIGCVDQPVAVFRLASSAPYPIAVRGAAPTAPPTPTATPSPRPSGLPTRAPTRAKPHGE
jgi:hypothetical protein